MNNLDEIVEGHRPADTDDTVWVGEHHVDGEHARTRWHPIRRADVITWSQPTTGQGRELPPVPIIELADSYTPTTDVGRAAAAMMRAWGHNDPTSGVSQHPASYVANFADMARAALLSVQGWHERNPHVLGK